MAGGSRPIQHMWPNLKSSWESRLLRREAKRAEGTSHAVGLPCEGGLGVLRPPENFDF